MYNFDEKKTRVCSVKEVAVHFFVGVNPQTASRNLRREIARFHELRDALEACGWHNNKRFFTPKQIEVLVEHMGEPE